MKHVPIASNLSRALNHTQIDAYTNRDVLSRVETHTKKRKQK